MTNSHATVSLIKGDADLLAMLAGGDTPKQIARKLNRSWSGLRRRLRKVYRRCGAETPAEAINNWLKAAETVSSTLPPSHL